MNVNSDSRAHEMPCLTLWSRLGCVGIDFARVLLEALVRIAPHSIDSQGHVSVLRLKLG